MNEGAARRRRASDRLGLVALSDRWRELHWTIQTLIAATATFGAIMFGSHQGLSWIEAQSRLEPRLIRVERLATQDSAVNVAQQIQLDTLEKNQGDLKAFATSNRDLLMAINDGVLRLLCRESGGSPARCDAEAIQRARVGR